MSSRSHVALAAFLAGSVLLSVGAAIPQKPAEVGAKKAALAVGSPAPALRVEKWVKGSPVPAFEKGKVYVVEFWATWCGPCIASMPHLSAIQRQYKDKGVTLIGMTSEDPDNALSAVEAMVKRKGDGMGYTVAWDEGHATNEAFMKAAGKSGIPCSFVVDGAGRIAFIGHPMFLDAPLEQIVAGTWDIEKGNAAIAAAESTLYGIQKTIGKDPKRALATILEFEKEYPAFSNLVAALKFDALLGSGDFQSAYACGGKLVDEAIASGNSMELNRLAWKIVDPEASWASVDLDLAYRAAAKAVALTDEKDGAVLDTLARVHFLKGDVAKAIECETKAVALSTGEMKAELEKTLAEYKAKGTKQ
jgi:thiol-disulfide isomerase/thioredoxin